MRFGAKDRGDAAETAACRYLRDKGLELVERNFRCRFGELDIIARDGDTLVFVEVRCRNNPRFGNAAESVDLRKQQRLIRAASAYLSRHYQYELPCRFDVIEATQYRDTFQLHWLTDAFQL